MIEDTTRVTPSPNQVSCDMGQVAASLNIESGEYHEMNSVAGRIWNLIQNSPTVGEIQETILNEYEVSEEQCRKDLLELLEQMRAEGLVELKP